MLCLPPCGVVTMLMPNDAVPGPESCTLVFVPLTSCPSTSIWHTPRAWEPPPSTVPSTTTKYFRGNPVEPSTSPAAPLARRGAPAASHRVVQCVELARSHGVVPVWAFVLPTPSVLSRASLLRPLYSTFLLVAAYAPPPSATQRAMNPTIRPAEGRRLNNFCIQNHSLSDVVSVR